MIVLYDEIVAHLMEMIEIPAHDDRDARRPQMGGRRAGGYLPYAETGRSRAVMSRPATAIACMSRASPIRRTAFPTQKPRSRRPRADPHPRQDRAKESSGHRKVEEIGVDDADMFDRRRRHRRARRAQRRRDLRKEA